MQMLSDASNYSNMIAMYDIDSPFKFNKKTNKNAHAACVTHRYSCILIHRILICIVSSLKEVYNSVTVPA